MARRVSIGTDNFLISRPGIDLSSCVIYLSTYTATVYFNAGDVITVSGSGKAGLDRTYTVTQLISGVNNGRNAVKCVFNSTQPVLGAGIITPITGGYRVDNRELGFHADNITWGNAARGFVTGWLDVVPYGWDTRNLAFDGLTSRYAGVHLSGVVDFNNATWALSTNTTYTFFVNFIGTLTMERRYYTINLGKTFPNPPQVIYAFANTGAGFDTGAFPQYSTVTLGSDPRTYYGSVLRAATTTTSLILSVDYPQGAYGGYSITNWRFAYCVFNT